MERTVRPHSIHLPDYCSSSQCPKKTIPQCSRKSRTTSPMTGKRSSSVRKLEWKRETDADIGTSGSSARAAQVNTMNAGEYKEDAHESSGTGQTERLFFREEGLEEVPAAGELLRRCRKASHVVACLSIAFSFLSVYSVSLSFYAMNNRLIWN